jgi:branched-chain amino acid transport system substrate-binding protein
MGFDAIYFYEYIGDMNKTHWIIIGLILIALGIWGFTKGDNEPTSEEPIKVGAILPLSGGSVDQGEWIRKGLDLVLVKINKDSDRKIEIIYEDSQGDTKQAVSAYNKLRLDYKVPIVITWGSGVGIALTPLVNRDKVIQMGVATASPDYSTPDDYTFRNFPSANLESDFLVDSVINLLGVRDITIMKINNDYGIGSAGSFKAKFVEKGGNVLAEETFEVGSSDLRTQLAKINSAESDVVYIASYPTEGALLLRQAYEMGVDKTFIASVAILGGQNFFEIAGVGAEDLLVINSVPAFSNTESSKVREFLNDYKKTYNEDAGPGPLYSARAYDALTILSGLINDCGNNTDCIKRGLYEVDKYNGVGGEISFDENGDVSSNFELQVVKNGQFVRY